MKKFLTTFLVLMTVLCGILGLAACGETETSNSDHTVHEWGEWSIVREATCKDDGLRERSCACGEKETEPIPADPAKHVFDEGVVTVQATCSAEGEKLFTCTVCKTTKTESLPIEENAHEWDNGQVTTPATCTKEGVKTFHCQHDNSHTRTEKIEIDEEAHEWDNGQVTTPATCTTPGVKTFHCQHDNSHTKTEKIEIDEDAHLWDNGQVTTPATCTKEGVKTFYCQHDNSHTKTEKIEIDEDAHLWDNGQVTTPATCTTPGVKTFHCQRDNSHTKTEDIEIDKDAHLWDNGQVTTPATCTKEGTKTFQCQHNPSHKREEQIGIDKDAHTWDNGQVTTPATCTTPGVKTVTCTSCQKTQTQTIEVDDNAHLWDNGQVTTPATCSKEGVKTFHCQRDNSHTRTEEIEIDEDAHLWDNGQVTTPATCTKEGVKTFYCQHDHSHERTEQIEIDEDAHTWDNGQVTTPATCTTQGVKTFHCQNDNTHTKTENTQIDKDAHLWDNGQVTTPATCTKEGVKTFYCQHDHSHTRTEEIEIDEDAHLWDEGQITVAATCMAPGEKVLHCQHNELHTKKETIEIDDEAHIWDPENSRSENNGHHSLICKLNPLHTKQEECSYLENSVAATCDKGGYTEYTCKYCNYYYKSQETSRPLGHNWDDGIIVPDSEHRGQHIVVCANDPTHHQEVACEYEINVVEPGCETRGYTTKYCPKCSDFFETDVKAATDHAWGNWERVPGMNEHIKRCKNDPNHTQSEQCSFEPFVTKPTCTTDGFTTYRCKDCTNEYVDDQKDALGHSYRAPEHMQETANAESKHKQECEVCGNVEETACTFADREISALSCMQDGVVRHTCLQCSYYYDVTTQKLPHEWGNYTSDNNGFHTRRCTRTDCTAEDTVACAFEDTLIPATCTTNAYLSRVCKEPSCNYNTVVEQLETMLGHDYTSEKAVVRPLGDRMHEITCGNGCGETQTMACEPNEGVVTDPTCTAKGFTTYTCNVCKGSYTDNETDMIAHVFGPWKPVEGYSAANTKHEQFCTVCRQRAEEPCTGFTTTTTDATCYKEGSVLTVCDVCKGEQTEVLEKTEHTWGQYRSKDATGHYRVCTVPECLAEEEVSQHHMTDAKKLPTCTDVGSLDEMCSDCGYVADGEDVPALGHDYTGVTWQYATDRPGNHYRRCTNCQEIVYEQCVNELHTENATCMKAEKHITTCTSCQHQETETIGSPLECSYVYTKNDNGTHTRTCLRGEACDNPDSTLENVACDYKSVKTDATCIADAYTTKTCSLCGYVTVETDANSAKGHSFKGACTSNSNGTHTLSCINCDATQQENCAYNAGKVTEPTCTSQGYTTRTCSKCSYVTKEDYTSTKPHNWGSTYTSTKNGKHYLTCTVCKQHSTEENCSYKTVEHAASCTQAPYTTYTCKNCSYSYTKTTGSKLEHNWKVKTPATEHSHNRTHELICQACSTTKTEKCTDQVDETPATCNAPLHHKHTCIKCQSVYEHDEGTKLEHTWKVTPGSSLDHTHTKTCSSCGTERTESCTGKLTSIKDPTCTEAGWSEYVCTVCQGTYTADPTPAKGHSIVFRVWFQSTDGETHYRQCPDCGTKETGDCVFQTTISRTEPTCDKTGKAITECPKCSRRKTETLAARGHQYPDTWVKSTDGKQHYRMCEREGCEYRNTKACVLVPINESDVYCNAPGIVGLTCKDCGYMNSAAARPTEHNWSPWTNDGEGHHSRHCTRMGCSTTQTADCTLDVTHTSLTCTTPEADTSVCNTCGFKKVEIKNAAAGHSWVLQEDISDSNHKAQCDVCGEQVSGPHDFEDSNICSVCKYDGLNYKLSADGSYYILENDNRVSAAEHIIVPAIHETLPVKAVADCAFQLNKTINTVVLPKCMTSLGYCAFFNCPNLTSVKFEGEGLVMLETLSSNAFAGCTNLQIIPLSDLTKLTYIAPYAFRDCKALANISISNSVTYIGRDAFAGTAAYNTWKNGNEDAFFLGYHLLRLRESYSAGSGAYTIPETTISVGANAFENCTGLKSLTMYGAVKYFDEDAFKGCENLDSLEYKGSLADWLAITFKNDLASPLHFVSGFHITNTERELVIPGNVVSIPAGTFRNSTILEKITIPASVKSIGARAFEGCINLNDIELPDTVTYIGEDAFKGCVKLQAIENNTDENGGFYIGHHLISVDNSKLPESGAYTVRKGTVTISSRAFANCTKLKSIVIPSSIKWIGAGAFSDCQNLGDVTFEGEAPVFFATNRQGVGRWLDDSEIEGARGAGNLKYYFTGEWKRIN